MFLQRVLQTFRLLHILQQVTQNVIEIVLGDMVMSAGCGCITREEYIQQYSNLIINQVALALYNNGSIPNFVPCPLQTMVARISPSACATDCIATGCYRVWPDGSYGEIYKRWSCTSTVTCRYNYSVCCNTSNGNCPPNNLTTTYLGFETIGDPVQCGTISVSNNSYCNCLFENCVLECKPTCK